MSRIIKLGFVAIFIILVTYLYLERYSKQIEFVQIDGVEMIIEESSYDYVPDKIGLKFESFEIDKTFSTNIHIQNFPVDGKDFGLYLSLPIDFDENELRAKIYTKLVDSTGKVIWEVDSSFEEWTFTESPRASKKRKEFFYVSDKADSFLTANNDFEYDLFLNYQPLDTNINQKEPEIFFLIYTGGQK